MFIRNRAIQVGSLLLGVAALLIAVNACGGSASSGPTATATTAAVPTRPVSPTATTVSPATPSATRTSAPATAVPQASPSATPTRAATAVPQASPSATPTRAATAPTVSAATSTPRAVSTSIPASGAPSQVIEVDITSDPYLFIPDTFTFQAGKTYTLRFKPQKEPHTFTVAGLGLNVFINAGETVEQKVSFVDVGTYKLVCVIHEQLGQIGKVIVAPGP